MTENPGNPPVRVIWRFVPWASLFYYVVAAAALLALAPYLAWREADWRFSLFPIAPACYFLIRLGLARVMILIATESEFTIVRRPLFRWFGSFEIIPAADIRRFRYSLQVHDKRDSDGDTRSEDHFCLDVITADSRIIKVIDSNGMPLSRPALRNMAALMRVPYEESLNRPG